MFRYFGLNKKVTALAPIDGYTDCAFRETVKKYSSPDLLFTEFVNAQGLIRATDKLIEILRYTENQRPIIAQLFGRDPEYFYKASLLVLKLGFDGIDINMGCPAKNIASKGGGAALIREPKLAVDIIKACRKARSDYKKGSISGYFFAKASKHKWLDSLSNIIKEKVTEWKVKEDREREITVSVKTRTGYDEDITEEWIKTLASSRPDFITLHARTYKQKFKGEADWSTIKEAVQSTDIPVIGNGDVKSYDDIQEMLEQTDCAGVMIGRGSFGKPWVFSKLKFKSQISNIKKIALEHAKLYRKYKGEKRFYEFRKHLVSYFKGFKGAKELRIKVVQVGNLTDLEEIFSRL